MTGGGKDGNSDVNGIGIDGPNVGKLANDIDEVVIDGSGDRGPGRTNCWSIRSRGFRCPVVIKTTSSQILAGRRLANSRM